MYKAILPLLLLPALWLCSCHKPCVPDAPQNMQHSLAMLKVDYQTHAFEGGAVLYFPGAAAAGDSIPLTVIYKAPGDFGNITLKYAPTGDTVLDGGIIWMGLGQIHYPAFQPSGGFGNGGSLAAAPGSGSVQGIYTEMFNQPFTDSTLQLAWAGIAPLSITQQYASARKALYLYTPSVGVGNPADWDYIWMLYQ